MKEKLVLFAVLALFMAGSKSYGQQVDTIQTVNYGKMPPVYFSNRIYWEKNYDKDNHLLYEALKYNTCFIGDFINYWDNGKIKTRGQYLRDTTVSLRDMEKNSTCSTVHGVWKNYNEAGELTLSVLYDKGKLIKEY